MRKYIHFWFYFLPIQLVLLHFRRNQILLLFWLILFTTVAGIFATNFGAYNLFLSPQYLGKNNFIAYLFLGMTFAVFTMSWHITTFIIHSKRIVFLAYTRHAFLIYCINNSIIPITFIVFYYIKTFLFLYQEESISIFKILTWLFSYTLGMSIAFLISILYFFNLGKDIFKTTVERFANPSGIRKFIPYDQLDADYYRLTVEGFLTGTFKIKSVKSIKGNTSLRLLSEVLNRHHRNAIFAIIIAFVALIIIGIFMDYPIFKIPAGAGFLLLFSILIAGLGMFKYFLKTWELLGWIVVFTVLGLLINFKVLDFRNHVVNLDYFGKNEPEYSYTSLKNTFTDTAYIVDKEKEEERLKNWFAARNEEKQKVIIITSSGGGSRSAFWTFRALQVADSMTQGKVFKNSLLVTGASGGMLGASYWRNLYALNPEFSFYNDKESVNYIDGIGGDLLNSVVLGLVTIDVLSPFNKINFKSWRNNKDRGLIFENALSEMTDSVLSGSIQKHVKKEDQGELPLLLPYATILNDGRKVIFASRTMSFLTRGKLQLGSDQPSIDAIDFLSFFKMQGAENISINSALRMSASFPMILPITNLPSQPRIQILDAGLRDNFGDEIVWRYIISMEEVLKEIASEIIILQIRDTEENNPKPIREVASLLHYFTDPFFSIQTNWSAFQSYKTSYHEDVINSFNSDLKISKIVLSYTPVEKNNKAPINFYLTNKQKEDILNAIKSKRNQELLLELQELLGNDN